MSAVVWLGLRQVCVDDDTAAGFRTSNLERAQNVLRRVDTLPPRRRTWTAPSDVRGWSWRIGFGSG